MLWPQAMEGLTCFQALHGRTLVHNNGRWPFFRNRREPLWAWPKDSASHHIDVVLIHEKDIVRVLDCDRYSTALAQAGSLGMQLQLQPSQPTKEGDGARFKETCSCTLQEESQCPKRPADTCTLMYFLNFIFVLFVFYNANCIMHRQQTHMTGQDGATNDGAWEGVSGASPGRV